MKRLLFFLVCIMGFSFSNAQISGEKFYCYGIDYSYVKVFGAKESPLQLEEAFKEINYLLISQRNKYDFSNMVNTHVEIDIEPMLEKLTKNDYQDIKLYRSDFQIFDFDCSEIVKEYDLQENAGIGIVLIAKLLNKDKKIGTYYVVMFDIASRDIVYCKEVDGKASGFGLRNFWAFSVYHIIKTTKINTDQN